MFTSQVQPLPKLATALSVNCAFNTPPQMYTYISDDDAAHPQQREQDPDTHLILELGDAAEGLLDELLQLGRDLAGLADRGHAVPVERVIPQLGRVVEEGGVVGRLGHQDHVLQALVLQRGTYTHSTRSAFSSLFSFERGKEM